MSLLATYYVMLFWCAVARSGFNMLLVMMVCFGVYLDVLFLS